MQKTQKIQCPNCGNTSSFETIRTGSYKCGYCHSRWEQATIAPEYNTNTVFRDLIVKLFEDYEKLTPERPKFVDRSFHTILGVYNYLLEMKEGPVTQDLLPKFREMTAQQIEHYKELGITKDTTKKELIARDADEKSFIMHHFLAEFYKMLASIETKFSSEEASLQRAMEHSQIAQNLSSSAIDDFDKEMATLHFNVLQRTKDQDIAYTWLDHLLHRFPEKSIPEDLTISLGYAPEEDDIRNYKKQIENYKEEVTLLFEEVIFSKSFQDWKKQQTIKS